MAIQCQYDLEAHIGHIITFLLHPHKLFCPFSAEKLARLKLQQQIACHRKLRHKIA